MNAQVNPIQLKLNRIYSLAELQHLIVDKELEVKHFDHVRFRVIKGVKTYHFTKLPNNRARLTAIAQI